MAKVLLLTSGYGMGHFQVADTLRLAFTKKGYRVMMLDLYHQSHPVIDHFGKKAYLNSFRFAPEIYAYMYYQWDKKPSALLNYFFALGKRVLLSYIEQYEPDMIVSTFPFLTYGKLKKKTGIDIPYYMVITDYYPHAQWVQPYVNHYFVAHETMVEKMENLGIHRSHITVTGIPVRHEFNRIREAKMATENTHFLFVAGSYGVLPYFKKTLRYMSEHHPMTPVTMITGKNEKLYKSLYPFQTNQIRIKGFVKDIYQDMWSADCMITKPGGVTVTEAMHTQTPMIFYQPVGGQELENAKFLKKQGASLYTFKENRFFHMIRDFVEHPEHIAAYRERQFALCRKDSDQMIVTLIDSWH